MLTVIELNDKQTIAANFTGIVIRQKQGKFWFKEGKYHREDGPAVDLISGQKLWYLESKVYYEINLKDHVVLDYYQGRYSLMWYKLLYRDCIFEFPDIPGLIIKE